MTDLKEKIVEILENLSEEEIIEVHNNYCNDVCNYDDVIYPMDEFDNELSGLTPSEVLEEVDSDFSLYDGYFWRSIYGLCSDDYPSSSIVDFDAIAEYITETGDGYGVEEIEELLSEEEEEEEI